MLTFDFYQSEVISNPFDCPAMSAGAKIRVKAAFFNRKLNSRRTLTTPSAEFPGQVKVLSPFLTSPVSPLAASVKPLAGLVKPSPSAYFIIVLV